MSDVSNYKVYGTLPTIGVEQVQKLIEQSEGGGSALPEVTADDNGKVLKVVEGEWDKAEAGGGGIMFVHPDANMTLDKTWQEILDADYVVLKVEAGTGELVDNHFLNIAYINSAGLNYTVGFYSFGLQQVLDFATDSADGYPVLNQEGG